MILSEYGETWFDYIESLVMKRVRTGLENKGIEASFTTEAKNVSNTELPCVYLHDLEGSEMGNTLINDGVNAVRSYIQIDVYANTKTDCRKISRLALAQMKALGYNANALTTILQDEVDLYHSITRFNRVIGSNDNI